MKKILVNKIRQERKKQRIRGKAQGTKEMPRLSVFRSNTYMYAQLIDDTKGETLVTVSEKHLEKPIGTKTQRAKQVGVVLAKKATEKKIKKAVFDRGSYRYHGRVEAVAQGAREGGLIV